MLPNLCFKKIESNPTLYLIFYDNFNDSNFTFLLNTSLLLIVSVIILICKLLNGKINIKGIFSDIFNKNKSKYKTV